MLGFFQLKHVSPKPLLFPLKKIALFNRSLSSSTAQNFPSDHFSSSPPSIKASTSRPLNLYFYFLLVQLDVWVRFKMWDPPPMLPDVRTENVWRRKLPFDTNNVPRKLISSEKNVLESL